MLNKEVYEFYQHLHLCLLEWLCMYVGRNLIIICCAPFAAVQKLTPEVNIQFRFRNSSQNMPFNTFTVVHMQDLRCVILKLILRNSIFFPPPPLPKKKIKKIGQGHSPLQLASRPPEGA